MSRAMLAGQNIKNNVCKLRAEGLSPAFRRMLLLKHSSDFISKAVTPLASVRLLLKFEVPYYFYYFLQGIG